MCATREGNFLWYYRPSPSLSPRARTHTWGIKRIRNFSLYSLYLSHARGHTYTCLDPIYNQSIERYSPSLSLPLGARQKESHGAEFNRLYTALSCRRFSSSPSRTRDIFYVLRRAHSLAPGRYPDIPTYTGVHTHTHTHAYVWTHIHRESERRRKRDTYVRGVSWHLLAKLGRNDIVGRQDFLAGLQLCPGGQGKQRIYFTFLPPLSLSPSHPRTVWRWTTSRCRVQCSIRRGIGGEETTTGFYLHFRASAFGINFSSRRATLRGSMEAM